MTETGKPIATRRKPGAQKPQPKIELPPLRDIRARPRLRHYLAIFSFFALFLLPSAAVNVYLQAYAADQYVSRASLTVDSDDFIATSGMLGDLIRPQKAEASDTDILFDFILSQDLVRRIENRLDLRKLYSKRLGQDPLLSLSPDAPIEDLVEYWRFMVDVAYEPRQGIIELRVRAFDPEDALAINEAIIEESHRLINALTAAARQDAVRYAQADLDEARARLDSLFERLRRFRNDNRTVLPTAEASARFSIISSLQDMMAEALIERASLIETTRVGDPRLARLDRRISAITEQIAAERSRLGSETDPEVGRPISAILAEYEEILVDLEFAIGAYLSALATLDVARTEARRLARYVAVHVRPTRPEASAYPERVLLGILIPGLLLTGWLIVIFVGYNLRDSK